MGGHRDDLSKEAGSLPEKSAPIPFFGFVIRKVRISFLNLLVGEPAYGSKGIFARSPWLRVMSPKSLMGRISLGFPILP